MRADTLAHRVAGSGAKVTIGLRRTRAGAIGIARVGEHAALAGAATPPPPRTRRQRLSAALPRERRNHAPPGEKAKDAGGRWLADDDPRGTERPQFRREGDLMRAGGDIER